MTKPNTEAPAATPSGWLGRKLVQLLMKHATVVACESLGKAFRIVTLDSPQFRDIAWTAGHKLQIAMGSAFTSRTFTPIEWDPVAGRTRLVVYLHGDGPGAAWAEHLRPGAQCDVFGPRASLDVGGVSGPLAVIGDETSIGLAYALTHQVPQRNVRRLLEVTRASEAEHALAALGLHANELFERALSGAHLAEMEGRLPILASAGATFVLTGEAASIQRLRRALKRLDVPASRLFAKAYWAPNKTGLD